MLRIVFFIFLGWVIATYDVLPQLGKTLVDTGARDAIVNKLEEIK